jgi:ribosomal protein S18 acetylase RimI-like enzyme
MNLTNRVSGLLLTPEPAPCPGRRQPAGLLVRFALHEDLDAILDIEAACWRRALTRAEWVALMADRRIIGAVADADGRGVLGHMLCRLHPRSFEVLRLAVDPRHRRRGVGWSMLTYLRRCGATSARRSSFGVVSEWLLEAHLWLRACNWQAVRVLRGAGAAREDCYQFGCAW